MSESTGKILPPVASASAKHLEKAPSKKKSGDAVEKDLPSQSQSPQTRLSRLAATKLGGVSVTYVDYAKEETGRDGHRFVTIVTVATNPPQVSIQ